MLNSLIAYLVVRFEDLKEREEGQGLIEYSLICALIAVASIVVMRALGVDIGEIFGRISTALDGAAPAA